MTEKGFRGDIGNTKKMKTDRHTDTQTDTQTPRHTDTQTDWHTDRQTDRQTDGYIDRETHRDGQAETCTVHLPIQIDNLTSLLYCNLIYFWISLYCTVLYCTVLYCTALHCTVWWLHSSLWVWSLFVLFMWLLRDII